MKTLAVVILDKFADWEPALLAAGLQSIIGGYTVRWASVEQASRSQEICAVADTTNRFARILEIMQD